MFTDMNWLPDSVLEVVALLTVIITCYKISSLKLAPLTITTNATMSLHDMKQYDIDADLKSLYWYKVDEPHKTSIWKTVIFASYVVRDKGPEIYSCVSLTLFHSKRYLASTCISVFVLEVHNQASRFLGCNASSIVIVSMNYNEYPV